MRELGSWRVFQAELLPQGFGMGEGEFGVVSVVSVIESANPPWLGEHHVEG